MATYAKLKLSSLYPHTEVIESINESLDLYGHANFNALSDEMLEVLQQTQPVHVVPANSDQKTYLFFAGWQLLHELRHRDKSTAYAVIHTGPPPNLRDWVAMAELALSSAAVTYIQSPERANHLLSRNKRLWKKIFKDSSPRTSATALERLCGISRTKAQRISTPVTTATEPSLLQKILNASTPEGESGDQHAIEQKSRRQHPENP